MKYKVLRIEIGGRFRLICSPTDLQTARIAFKEEDWKISQRGIRSVTRQPHRIVYEGMTLLLCEHKGKRK